MPSPVDPNGKPPSLVHVVDVKRSLGDESGPEDYEPDGCGFGLRSPTLMLRAVATKGRRVWRLPYGAFIPSECETEGEPRAVFTFAMERDDMHLVITGNPKYQNDPEKNLEAIVRQIEDGHRRVVRANGDRVLDVAVVDRIPAPPKR